MLVVSKRMIQREDTIASHLDTIPESEWHKLFKLADNMELSLNGGLLKELRDKSIVQYEWWSSGKEIPEIIELNQLLHELGLLVSFDWTSWKHGQTLIQRAIKESDDVDLISLCKLLTLIVRADRFNDSILYQQIIQGNVLNILKIIKRIKAKD
jgi:hypothetical protein